MERLTILGEEGAELAQAIFKIQRFGFEARNQDNLVQEMGDVIQMISIVCEELEIPWEVVEAAARAKKEKLQHWVRHK